MGAAVRQFQQETAAAARHGSPLGAFALGVIIPGGGYFVSRGVTGLLWPGIAAIVVGVPLAGFAVMLGWPGAFGVLFLLLIWNGLFAGWAYSDVGKQRIGRRMLAVENALQTLQGMGAPLEAAATQLAAQMRPLHDQLKNAEVTCPSCQTIHTFASFEKCRYKCPSCKSDIWRSSNDRLQQAIGTQHFDTAMSFFGFAAKFNDVGKKQQEIVREAKEIERQIRSDTVAAREARNRELLERQTAALEESANSLRELETLKWQEKWGLWPK